MSALESYNRQGEFVRNNGIFISALHTSIDFALATGGHLPTYENYQALYLNGFLDHTPEEIFEASESEGIEDFHIFIQPWCVDEIARQKSLREQSLARMEAERPQLPVQLFKEIKKTKKGATITDLEASDDIKLMRFVRWKIAESYKTGGDLGLKNELSEKSLLDVVLEINIDNGALLSSFKTMLVERRKGLTQYAIEKRAEDMGFYELAFPGDRQNYLKDLIANSTAAIPPDKDKLPMLKLDPGEFVIDTNTGALLLGQLSVAEFRKSRIGRWAKVRKLTDLLLDDTVDLNFVEHHPLRHSHWEKDDYLNYGKWLLKIIAPTARINREILARAYHLGLGPNRWAITQRFDGIDDFNIQIEALKKQPFKSWSQDEWINWAQAVANDNNGRFTYKIIEQRARESNGREPGRRAVRTYAGGARILIKEAGLAPTEGQAFSHELCVSAGLTFYEKTGRLPKIRDLITDPSLPSPQTVRKHCQTTANFNNLIERAVQSGDRTSRPVEVESMAA